jgi:ATP-binding cassette subfamily B protein
MTSTVERDLAALGAPWEPVAVDERHGPPGAVVDPDPSRGWIRRVLPLFAVRRAAVIASLICAFAAMLTQVAVPRITMAAIDTTLSDRSAGVMPYVWILLAMAAARGILTFVYRFHLYRVAYDVEYDLRVAMYEHLTRMSFSFFDRVQSGQLISRANSDIRSMQLFLTFAPLLALNIVSFLVAFGLMLSVDVTLALVALAPLPFVYLVGVRMRDLTFPTSWVIQARTADTATIVEENLTGVRVVKSFAAEKSQIRALAAAARRLQWVSVRQIDVRANYSPLMEGLPRLGMAAVLLYGGILAIDGRVTVGTIVAFSTYVVMLQAPFRMLGFFMMMGQRAAASAGRIYEILDTPPEIVDRPGAVDLVDPEGRVAYRDVTFGYGDGPPVLDHFDVQIEAGETVALVGRTGCGKSTVARLLTRFYDVDSGHVEIDGLDVRDATLASVRAQVSMVLDEPFLFSASVRDNIAYGRPDASLDAVVTAARAANATEFIDALPDGYATQVGERGYTLSGGQRQRIAIARTLLINPRVLILDDATSAVDVHVEEEIHTALKTLMRGRTTLIIAHRLSTIGLAERVLLLEHGRIVADGTHAGLMATEPRYAEVLAHIEEDEAAKRARLLDRSHNALGVAAGAAPTSSGDDLLRGLA